MMIYNNDSLPPEESREDAAELVFQEATEESNLIGLSGDVSEAAAQQIILTLLTFNGGKILNSDASMFEDVDDIEFFLSSSGGCVNEMFAIYDIMRLVKANRDIATFGYGKIASAAVPLLAAGTPGKRYIGKHTRLMLHHCSSNASGPHPNVRSNFEELKKVEEMMIQALADNSNLSVGEIYNIMSRNTDEFFSAEEALEMGIVDKII